MKLDIVMPKMGESITEGTILEWRKAIGDRIAKDEILLEIGTDKVDSEIPSPHSGVLTEILAQPNEVVAVGVPIARIETDASGDESPPPEKKEAAQPDREEPLPSEEKDIPVQRQKSSTKRFYTPVVLKIARDSGLPLVELERIPGSGKGGRVTKKDIVAYLAGDRPSTQSPPRPESAAAEPAAVALASDRREPMDHMRKLIADHMRASLDTSAHVYVVTEVDMTAIVRFVNDNQRQFSAREGFKLTYTPFIFHATVQALKAFPLVNASLDGQDILYHKHINLGMAVAVEKGLMVPALPRCEELNFLGLCRKINDLARRTRHKQISPDELTGSTFTVTNFGVFNVTMGMPIINQPNVAILGVGTIKKRPVVIESPGGDTIGIRSIMYLSLGLDHRLIDGAGGSRFLDHIRVTLETLDLEALL